MTKAETKPLTPTEKQAQLWERIRLQGGKKNGWMKNIGWAKDDPYYDEAMKLGEEYRRAQREE